MSEPRVTVVLPVLIEHPWQVPMTECALETLTCTTNQPFKIIVVETLAQPDYVDEMPEGFISWPGKDVTSYNMCLNYCKIVMHRRTNPTHDINVGLAQVDTEFVLYMGNDVFVRPDWQEALLDCFKIKDCGIATLASADLHGTFAATYAGQSVIKEGFYGPFSLTRSHWRFDEIRYPSQFADSDLMMRVYDAGLRSYRNNAVVIQHLNKQTINGPNHESGLKEARFRFEKQWGKHPMLISRVLIEGLII